MNCCWKTAKVCQTIIHLGCGALQPRPLPACLECCSCLSDAVAAAAAAVVAMGAGGVEDLLGK